MKIGPDGSLPRITSTYKGLTSRAKIVKVPEDDGSGVVYKLVFNEKDEESESEKSDEELWSDEDIANPSGNTNPSNNANPSDNTNPSNNANPSEKDKSIESTDLSCNQSLIESKSQNVELERRYNNSNRNRWNHYRFNNHGKRNNPHSSFNNRNLMASGSEERKSFNTNKRGYGSSGNYKKNSNQASQKMPETWLIPPAQNYQLAPYVCRPTYMPQPLQQVPPNSALDNPVIQNKKPGGPLWNSPYAPTHNFARRLDFQPNKQNEEFSPHPTNYQESKNNDGLLPLPSNYKPSNNNDNFSSPPMNYQASNHNDGFFPHPPNYEASSKKDEFIPPPTSYHQSKQNNKFIDGKNYYNNHHGDYGNRRRLHYGKPVRGQFSWQNPNHRKQWGNNYDRYHSHRTRENDKRNPNDNFDYRK